MNKLTKEEIQELEILMTRLENAVFEEEAAEDYNKVEIDFRKWVSQKKKEWTEWAVAEYRLKKKKETKFYTSGSGDNWKWKCIKCGAEGGLYDAHYGVLGGYICNNCLTDRP